MSEKIDGVPGTPLTLTANNESGALNAVDGSLRGVFEGGLKEYDDWTLKVPLPAALSLLRDDRTEQIVVLLDRTESVPEAKAALEAVLAREGLDLEVKPWSELALFHNQVVSLFRRELDVIKLIISTIVILGIANTIGMSIVERRVELATLRALGLRRGVIGRLLMTEALFTGLLRRRARACSWGWPSRLRPRADRDPLPVAPRRDASVPGRRRSRPGDRALLVRPVGRGDARRRDLPGLESAQPPDRADPTRRIGDTPLFLTNSADRTRL